MTEAEQEIIRSLKVMLSNESCTCEELGCEPAQCPTCLTTTPDDEEFEVFICGGETNCPII